MQTLVLYDITNTRVRTKVADACLDYGLDRTQFSTFIGELTREQQAALMARLTALLEDRNDSPAFVLLIPVGRRAWANRLEHCINQPPPAPRPVPVGVHPDWIPADDLEDEHPF